MKLRMDRIILVIILIVAVIGGVYYFTTPSNEVPEEEEIVVEEPENEFAVLSYYHEELLDDYLAYQELNSELSVEDIVTHVNMGIDEEFYASEAILIEDPYAIDVLVNKVYCFPDDFVPENLVYVDDYRGQQMCEEAALAFQALNAACQEEGFSIYAYSAYRSIDWQQQIYDNMVSLYGEERTNQTVSKATQSEHHTGLAVDVSIDGCDYNYCHENENYDTFYDLLDDYGFILRYPEGCEDLTGYSYESWHIRYLGVDLAKEVLASGLTYDEFVARQ